MNTKTEEEMVQDIIEEVTITNEIRWQSGQPLLPPNILRESAVFKWIRRHTIAMSASVLAGIVGWFTFEKLQTVIRALFSYISGNKFDIAGTVQATEDIDVLFPYLSLFFVAVLTWAYTYIYVVDKLEDVDHSDMKEEEARMIRKEIERQSKEAKRRYPNQAENIDIVTDRFIEELNSFRANKSEVKKVLKTVKDDNPYSKF